MTSATALVKRINFIPLPKAPELVVEGHAGEMTPGEERQSRSPVSASRALAAGVLEEIDTEPVSQ